MSKIYLDNAATTQIDDRVLEAMMKYLKEGFGNPSSIHQVGQEARSAIDNAREQVAKFLNAKPKEIIFTSGATESDNLAVQSFNQKGSHIITTQIEHPAILEACKTLEKNPAHIATQSVEGGGVQASYLKVNQEGIVDIELIAKAINEQTSLVSVMYANNEIGSIQPIAEIGKMLKTVNQKRKNKIYFHTDAVQAVNYLDCNVDALGVDILTLSGHKIYGPKGIGVLYVREGAPVKPIIFGGHQERGIRPGTENVANIVGLGKAIELVATPDFKTLNLRNKLIDAILKNVPAVRLNGSRENRLPNNANFSFKGAEGEALLMALDQEGIFASTGSACSLGSLSPSHVLLAIGLSREEAHGSLRITLGRYTKEQEIDKVIEVLPKIIQRLRKISGYKYE